MSQQWRELLCVLCLVNLIAGGADADSRRRHGESCQRENWCDYGKWLWCGIEGKCACLHPKRQTFDLSRNRCVGIIGTECNAYIGERDCPGNAFCSWNDGTGTCLCKTGFHVTKDRTCIPGAGNSGNEFLIFKVGENSNTRESPTSLPIHQYHQQRLGNVNYRYQIKTPVSNPARLNRVPRTNKAWNGIIDSENVATTKKIRNVRRPVLGGRKNNRHIQSGSSGAQRSL